MQSVDKRFLRPMQLPAPVTDDSDLPTKHDVHTAVQRRPKHAGEDEYEPLLVPFSSSRVAPGNA